MTVKSGGIRSALRQAQSTGREESQNIPNWKGPTSKDHEVRLLAPHSSTPKPGHISESIVQTLLSSGRLGAVTAWGSGLALTKAFPRTFTFRILSLAANPETTDCSSQPYAVARGMSGNINVPKERTTGQSLHCFLGLLETLSLEGIHVLPFYVVSTMFVM